MNLQTHFPYRLMRAITASLLTVGTIITFLTVMSPAHAGQKRCVTQHATVSSMINGVTLASQTKQVLEKANLQAGIIARVGQDLSEYHQYYSHIGFVYRDTANSGETVWRVVHKLNHCGSARADLFRQGLIEFFTDDPFELKAAVLPFKPGIDQQVLRVLTDPERVVAMHEPRYNLVANPWSIKYQQSNQWVTETLAMSMGAQVQYRAQAQQWLLLHGYQPDKLPISTMAQFGAELTKANVRFDDHPRKHRIRQRIRTTTADSVLRWTQLANLTDKPIVIQLARPYKASTKTERAAKPTLH